MPPPDIPSDDVATHTAAPVEVETMRTFPCDPALPVESNKTPPPLR